MNSAGGNCEPGTCIHCDEFRMNLQLNEGIAIHRTSISGTGWHAVKCPECGSLQDRSIMLVPGVEVHRCRGCGVISSDVPKPACSVTAMAWLILQVLVELR